MSPSKENARCMLDRLRELSDGIGQELRDRYSAKLIALEEFLLAAQKRLPTQAAIDRDKQRKKVKA